MCTKEKIMYPFLFKGFIPTFSLFIWIALIVCIFLYNNIWFHWSCCPNRFRKYGKTIIFCSFIGGKILSFISRPEAYFPSEKYNMYSILSLGFVFYGGLIGALIAIIIVCEGNIKEILSVTDTMLRLIPIGQAIGRIGCFFNGCCYGKAYEGLFAIRYPIAGKMIEVFPTWFVEAIGCLVLGTILLLNRDKQRGTYTFGYLGFYGLLRFCLEFVRGDEVRGMFLGLSTSQWISLLFILIGIAGMINIHYTNFMMKKSVNGGEIGYEQSGRKFTRVK